MRSIVRVVGLSLAVASIAGADEASLNSLATEGPFKGGLDPAIAEVSTGGYWTSGTQSGTYRVVVVRYGDDHTYTATYAQWIAIDSKTAEEAEVATVLVKKLSDSPMTVVRDVSFVRIEPTGSAVAEVVLRNRYSGETRKSWLTLRGPGSFEVGDSPGLVD